MCPTGPSSPDSGKAAGVALKHVGIIEHDPSDFPFAPSLHEPMGFQWEFLRYGIPNIHGKVALQEDPKS